MGPENAIGFIDRGTNTIDRVAAGHVSEFSSGGAEGAVPDTMGNYSGEP